MSVIFKSVTITNDFDKFERLTKISKDKVHLEFHDRVTVVSGSNGLGKSTIVDAISKRVLNAEVTGVEFETGSVVHYFFKLKDMDAKRMLETSGSLRYNGLYLSTWMDRAASSHGQMNSATLDDLACLCESEEPMVVFVDEPELGLDTDNLIKFIQLVKNSKCVQFIIASHHPFLLLDSAFAQLELSVGYRSKTRDYLTTLTGDL